MSKRRLGKGIDALLQGRPLEQLETMSSIISVPLDHIRPNPKQPRKHFDEESLKELSASIRSKGVIQPIIAEDAGDGFYVIVAGERRYRAAQLAGLEDIPVIPNEFSEEEKLEIALIENLQREDLNPIDEARAFRSMIEQAGYTQEQVSQRLGMSRSAIANSLRLLKLEPEIQEALSSGTLSAGHARALLAIESADERVRLYRTIVRERLSVRDAEQAARGGSAGAANASSGPDAPAIEIGDDLILSPGSPGRTSAGTAVGDRSVELRQIEERLVTALGTKVAVKGSETNGRIEVTYYSMEDLERVVEIIAGPFSS